MKPKRIQMAHELILSYDLYKHMNVYVNAIKSNSRMPTWRPRTRWPSSIPGITSILLKPVPSTKTRRHSWTSLIICSLWASKDKTSSWASRGIARSSTASTIFAGSPQVAHGIRPSYWPKTKPMWPSIGRADSITPKSKKLLVSVMWMI